MILLSNQYFLPKWIYFVVLTVIIAKINSWAYSDFFSWNLGKHWKIHYLSSFPRIERFRGIAMIRPRGGGGIGQPPSTRFTKRGPRTSSPILEDKWDIPWGDKMEPIKLDNKKYLQIIFWNCGGFPND
jgi:hypothetical protein